MSARHRLLVIDYEPRSLKRTLALLEGSGFAVSGAGTALEINAELNRAAPDAVIVEPMIPGQDGFKLIQSIKRLRPARPTFVIAASRIYRGPRFRGMAKEAGADLFVERPMQDDQILAALTRTLGDQPELTAPQPPDEVSAAALSSVPPPAAAEPAPAPLPPRPPAPPRPQVAAAPIAATTDPHAHHQPAPPSAVTAPRPIHTPSPARAGVPSVPPRPAAPASPPAATSAGQPAIATTSAGRPVLAAASAGPRATGASQRSPAPMPALPSSDAEIDAALDRLLGPFGGAAVEAAPAPAAASAPVRPMAPAPVAPAPIDATDPLGLALDRDYRVHRQEPRKVTGPLVAFDFDDAGGGAAPRPVVIPTRVDPVVPIAPPVVSIPDDALGFDPVTGDSGNISAPAGADDARDGRYMDFLLQEDPGTGPPPISPATWPRTGPIPIVAAPETPIQSADDDDIDRVLARVFAPGIDAQGEVPGIDAGDGSGRRDSGAAVDQSQSSLSASGSSAPDRPVPEGLRGMDAGTADLLSSLQELENSLPDGGPPSADLRADSAWTATTGFGDLTGQALQEIETSVPFTPPPPPEDEQTLQEVLASLGTMEAQPTAEEVDPALASPPVPFDAFRQTGTQFGFRGRTGPVATGHGTAPTAADPAARSPVQNAVAVSSRALVTGALVAVLLLALAAGGWYLFVRESAASSDSPAAPSESVGSAAPTGLPTAPEAAPGKKKPKPKKPAAAPADAVVTRPVPGDKKQPARGSSPASKAPGSGGTPPPPVAAAPRAPRPEPEPAAMRESRRVPVPAAQEPVSAADARVSAADMAAPVPAPAAATVFPSAGDPAPVPGGTDVPVETPIVRVSELDTPVSAVRRTIPPATAEAVAARIGGRAFLNVLVGADGAVQEARLMIDPGHGLGEAARRAAQSWSYTAPLRGGQPVRVWKTEVVEFEPPADETGDGAESR